MKIKGNPVSSQLPDSCCNTRSCRLSPAPPPQPSFAPGAWLSASILVAYKVTLRAVLKAQQGAATSFLLPFFGDQFQSSPHGQMRVAGVFVVAFAARPAALSHPRNLLLFSFFIRVPVGSFPTMLCGPASLLNPGWNLFITLPQPEKMPVFLALSLDLWPLSGLPAVASDSPCLP